MSTSISMTHPIWYKTSSDTTEEGLMPAALYRVMISRSSDLACIAVESSVDMVENRNVDNDVALY